MSQCMGTAHSCPTLEQIQSDWSKYNRLARWLAWSKLHWRDSVTDVDEAVSEAIAHAWKYFYRLRTTRPSTPVKTAVGYSIRYSASRVVRRIRFIPKPSPNFIDALDRRATQEFRCDDFSAGQALEIARCDVNDRYVVEEIIRKLPEEVQGLARLLSYGATKTSARQRRGLSRREADRQIASLRTALQEIFGTVER